MRAREINAYFNQLGEGLGTIVPPQVTSVSRKPLSIALEEIAADKIVGPAPEPSPRPTPTRPRPTTAGDRAAGDARAPSRPGGARSLDGRRDRPRRLRRHRRLQGGRGLPPARRRRRPRHARCSPTDAAALRRRARRSRRWRPSRPAPRCATSPTRSRTPASARRADLVVVAPATARLHRQVRRRHLRRPAHRHAARHPGAGARRARRCTPRCGSTPRCRTTSHAARRGACTSSSPSDGRLAGGDVGRGPPRRARRDRRRRRARARPRRRPRRAPRARHRRRHPRADRPGAVHQQPLVGQAGPRPRRRGRGPRAPTVTLVTTVDRPAPPGGRGRAGRDGGRDGATRCSAAAPTPTSS